MATSSLQSAFGYIFGTKEDAFNPQDLGTTAMAA
jgi:hypothetical protein